MADLEEALLKLSPKNGDIIFVDRSAVDPEALAGLVSPSPDQDNVTFIFVDVRPGMSLSEIIRSVPLEEIREHLATL
jgi:hypothetical protein